MLQKPLSLEKLQCILYPMWKRAVAWDLREIGSAWGKGVTEGPAPKEVGKISSQGPTKAGTTWASTRKTKQVWRDEGVFATTPEGP